jgi:hypothetical protein
LVIKFIEHLQPVTSSNYNAFANIHTLQITTARAKFSHLAMSSHARCLIAAFDNADSNYCFCAQRLLFSLAGAESESESYVTTDGQPASLAWNRAAIWGLRPDFYFCQTVAGLLIWGVFSEERTGLSFTIASGPRQRSHSRVRVPWESRLYFTVSDSRLPFSSPATTRRVTVEVFDSASTRDN